MAKSTKEMTQLKEPQPVSDSAAVASPWSPLAEPIFRALWTATVVSNIGTWMEDVIGGKQPAITHLIAEHVHG